MPSPTAGLAACVVERYGQRKAKPGDWTVAGQALGRLHVMYATADYSNHPTAHMAEALFHYHDRARVAATALAFGKV